MINIRIFWVIKVKSTSNGVVSDLLSPKNVPKNSLQTLPLFKELSTQSIFPIPLTKSPGSKTNFFPFFNSSDLFLKLLLFLGQNLSQCS